MTVKTNKGVDKLYRFIYEEHYGDKDYTCFLDLKEVKDIVDYIEQVKVDKILCYEATEDQLSYEAKCLQGQLDIATKLLSQTYIGTISCPLNTKSMKDNGLKTVLNCEERLKYKACAPEQCWQAFIQSEYYHRGVK